MLNGALYGLFSESVAGGEGEGEEELKEGSLFPVFLSCVPPSPPSPFLYEERNAISPESVGNRNLIYEILTTMDRLSLASCNTKRS